MCTVSLLSLTLYKISRCFVNMLQSKTLIIWNYTNFQFHNYLYNFRQIILKIKKNNSKVLCNCVVKLELLPLSSL